ncbi:Probable 37S ribosomal protein S5, mitochondrial [Serendipita indica DSM 11827]|uniref:Related to MRPS5-mitochondrial ribosomal protein, small subunit n=1 Tax=Serendipita indica (strain DSM 11827) TaxID=1109443 RepID=G4T7K4_SERID|nr:Probable 37S ribosomal protein S5, mitochondrial [Serendipita indica DSM 11827]CCA67301.1 related to MRPS5-mitochondrial ribosomal protein, small subunit [Serendipita indica DSM 11827]
MSAIGKTGLRIYLPARCRVARVSLSSKAPCYSTSRVGSKAPVSLGDAKGDRPVPKNDVRPLENKDGQSLKGEEPIYPIYTDVNPLFDTYVKAQHPRSLRPDSRGRIQPFKVSTTIFNDPPLFMIDPLQRPKQKYPTTRYIKSKSKTGATGEVGETSMAQMDLEDSLREGGAAAVWGADVRPAFDTTMEENRETPLDVALDQQAWNTGELYDQSGRWDRRKTPHGETSSLPSPSEAQTLPPSVVSTLMRFPLISKRVVQQGGKGRMPSWYVLTVAGNGDGLVGIGEGKDAENARAIEKSFIAACKDLDWVDRYENRTLWNDINTKWGATRVTLRPRPIGFGLRCNPYIHQLCKAAGIKDISAKVWGSRNGMNIIKACLRVLRGGHAPPMMGDGVGRKGSRMDKGYGMRGRGSIERERGRWLADNRLW